MKPPTIVVDTREQLAWSFDPAVAGTVRRALPAGDYSLDGLELVVAVERKSLDDFVGSAIRDWIRFRKELRRLAGYESAVVAVEANVEDVVHHKYNSDAHPNSVLGRAQSILLDYGVPVQFWGPRPAARMMSERFLLLAHKRYADGNDLGEVG